jgi:putative DNA primase/helicase
LPIFPPTPTQADARKALGELLEVVRDFPFRGETDRHGWVAGVLTPLARSLMPCVPAFVFSGNTPAVGKGLATDIIALITMGRRMTATPHAWEDEEVRKRILSFALAGDAEILIDNVPNGGTVGWPSLDAALTAGVIRDRVLGESRMASAPNLMTFYITGNNPVIKGDTCRRTILIRLESPHEHPEDRNDFVHSDLRGWVIAERPRLLAAALTILSAYLRAGCPSQACQSLGSFEEFSHLVRDAIMWAGGEDVCSLVAARDPDADPDADAQVALLCAWREYPEGLTAAGALGIVVSKGLFRQRGGARARRPGARGGGKWSWVGTRASWTTGW